MHSVVCVRQNEKDHDIKTRDHNLQDTYTPQRHPDSVSDDCTTTTKTKLSLSRDSGHFRNSGEAAFTGFWLFPYYLVALLQPFHLFIPHVIISKVEVLQELNSQGYHASRTI